MIIIRVIISSVIRETILAFIPAVRLIHHLRHLNGRHPVILPPYASMQTMNPSVVLIFPKSFNLYGNCEFIEFLSLSKCSPSSFVAN